MDWYHNGKKILPGGRIRIQASGGGSHAIIIMDTLVEDAGEYVAIARNAHGTASSSAVLDVTGNDKPYKRFYAEVAEAFLQISVVQVGRSFLLTPELNTLGAKCSPM